MVTVSDAGHTLVGAILSRRWRLTRKLGEGGMGEVYAVEPVEGGARAAVKLLKREFLGELDVLSRFQDEGRTCMRLLHPNIVRVTECARAEDGAPYLVMELLEGVPLSAYMQNGARVHLAQAAPIVGGILSALAFAHANGVVHRDLKPDNVYLTRDPSGAFVVKVLDFGIAKVMDAAGGMGSRTRTGMLLGTPAYMSPEQARNARDVDQRADLWSAGVLLYEMLTGRVAFPAPTEYARLAALLSVDPEPIERCDPSLAPLGPFLARALKKNREDRFGSAQEMLRALAAAAPGASLPLEPVGVEGAKAIALSRLPEVNSALFSLPTRVSAGGARPPKMAAPPAGERGAEIVEIVTPAESPHPTKAVPGGGTLASPVIRAPPEARSPAESRPSEGAPPPVPLASPALLGTLPSESRARARARVAQPPRLQGTPIVVVIALVVLALGIGFLCGWAFGRAT